MNPSTVFLAARSALAASGVASRRLSRLPIAIIIPGKVQPLARIRLAASRASQVKMAM
jgi:hypothetical protein